MNIKNFERNRKNTEFWKRLYVAHKIRKEGDKIPTEIAVISNFVMVLNNLNSKNNATVLTFIDCAVVRCVGI